MDDYMKNKLIALLTILAVPSVAFAAAGMVDSINDFRHWIYPAYLYNLKFGIAFLIVFVVLYFVFKKPIDKVYNKFSGYLKRHPTLAVIVCGVFFWLPFGIIMQALGYWDNGKINDYGITFLVIVLFGTVFGFIILSACGRFRNKVIISPLCLKVSSAIVLSAISASLLFIILTKTGVLKIDKMVYHTYRGGFKYITHPFDSVIYIWWYSGCSLWCILYSLIILWIGNAYRWLKSKWTQRVALHKFD